MLNNRCIVLGGNGFIGINLIKHLVSCDYIVSSFDLHMPKDPVEGVTYMAGNFINDNELLEAIKGQDIIIHLISTTNPGKSMVDPYSAYNIDVVQTIKILENIKETDAKIIFASSGGTVYGETKKCPIKEEHELNPISHYGIVKVTIEHIISMYNNVYGMNNKIMRISNPYGPGQDYTKGVGVIDAFIKKTILNEEIEIWGDGEIVRDYIYIEDLCNAFLAVLNYEGKEEVFNIGSGEGYSLNKVIGLIKHISNNNIEIKYKNVRTTDVKKVILNIDKAIHELNFKPLLNLKEGLNKHYKYLVDRLG